MEEQASVSDASIERNHALLLSMQFGVLKKILANLPARELGRAALVCHAWNDVCRIIRRERQCIHWFEWHSPKIGGKRALHSPRSKINEEIGRVYCVPQVCLFFSSESINSIAYEDDVNKETRLRKVRSQPACHSRPSSKGCPPAIGHLMKMMPSTCTTLGLRAYGTVGTTWDLTNTVEFRDKSSFSMLMLPKISGVHINPFVVQREAFMSIKSTKLKQGLLSDDQLGVLTGISPTDEIRCLIVFCDSSDGEDAAELIIQTLLKRMDNKMAVGGGIGDQFFTSASHSGPLLTGLAISGEEVRALSAVIPQNVTKVYKIQEILEQLKSCDLPSENCVGFMFSCMGRSVRKPKGVGGVESSLFRNYFPTVPLVGFFGSGEIGINFIVPFDYQDKSGSMDISKSEEPLFKKHKLNKTELMHQYSTIFVLASLRKGK